MRATARIASVVSSTLPVRRGLIRDVSISRDTHMRTAFLFLTLTVAFVGCVSRTTSSDHLPSELPDIQIDEYKVDPYIHLAIELQSLGRTRALARLHSMAQDRKFERRVITLCRMLFTRRPGSGFRRPLIGGASFSGGTDYGDWPLEPIEVTDGVPFLITRGYMGSGVPETDEKYLRYCETNCAWSDYRYSIKTEQQKRDALAKLLTSPKWKTPLNPFESQFFTDQIQ